MLIIDKSQAFMYINYSMITLEFYDFLFICIGCLVAGIPLGYIVEDISQFLIEVRNKEDN